MTPDGIDVSGGPGGITANTADMRATATALDRTNDALGDIAGHARGAALSGALLRTTIFSPVSAARAEASLVQAAVVVSGLTLRLEAVVLVLRTRAKLFDLADAGRNAIDVIVSMALAPLAIPLIALALVAPGTARRIVSAFPALTDLVTGGIVYWSAALGAGRPGVPRSYEGVLGVLQALAKAGGRWHGGKVTIRRSTAIDPVPPNSLAGILAGIGQLEEGPAKPDDRSAIRIIKIEHPGGPPTWIVQIPGMDFEGGPTDPGDGGANLSLMRRRDELLKAVLAAMENQRIGPHERVMLTGHSQGGIVAMALASDPAAQRRYDITHVVTAGSPVSRFEPPPNVRVLSIEHHQDPVPRLDTQPNPDRTNWTTVSRDLGDDPAVQADPIAAHGADEYAETAGMIDDRPDLMADFRPMLGDHAQPPTDYILRRSP